MEKEAILNALKDDEESGNGEILDIEENGVLYFDSGTGEETYYRFTRGCADEIVKKEIYLSKQIESNGFTKDFIINVLKAAYKDSYEDAISTLNGIIVISNETDYTNFLSKIEIHTSDDLTEWYDYTELENLCGVMLSAFKIVVINEKIIRNESINLGDEWYSAKKELEAGMIQTLIHEVRHCMMETNAFLSEEKYPQSLASEEAVEDFCRNAYEGLPGNLKSFYIGDDLDYTEEAMEI